MTATSLPGARREDTSIFADELVDLWIPPRKPVAGLSDCEREAVSLAYLKLSESLTEVPS